MGRVGDWETEKLSTIIKILDLRLWATKFNLLIWL
jgi:hypothetical protein